MSNRVCSGILVTMTVFSGPFCDIVTADEAPAVGQNAQAEHGNSRRVKRVLLVAQGPDNHGWSTHEYAAGLRLLVKCLAASDRVQPIVIFADDPWKEGPELLDGADGVVLFLSEGAKWLSQDPDRLAAFQKLAERGGGLVTLHWAMGTRSADPIDAYLNLFGGCHGGPDRKHKVVSVRITVADPSHPIMRGIGSYDVRDEFYYRLKFVEPAGSIHPLLSVPVDDDVHTVAWSWKRPDGGRSFGFSGCHFHDNWRLPQYRRMIAQATLWSVTEAIPEDGLSVEVTEKDLFLPPREDDDK